ncbi:sugar nucleotide-binding protein [Echinimonas agarilytica]|uniref:Sugar nucleotide-binding protein n=1 Tax=Echinimonas agarilytica TaxID=1215918 RepID=A0AA41W8T1_9GAMM|nr:sugar nucleotide-binding protein [Echinimonas agarilytica]MCM2681200.1 sugar nucleotide-binding protein [Echinimonas agarilytica]
MTQTVPSNQSRILIAGYGAIGKNMVKQAKQCLWISLNRSGTSDVLHHISADLNELAQDIDLNGIDYIVYTATPDQRTEESYKKTYVEGLQHLIRAVDKSSLKRFILVSSTSVYGQSEGEDVTEKSLTIPTGFSGKAILEGEQILLNSLLPCSIIRFGGIYGNGRNMLIRQVRKGVEVPNNPAAKTNRIHEDDCAGVLLHIIAQDERNADLAKLYIAVDDNGADKAQVYGFIEHELGLENKVNFIDQSPSNLGKRCINAALKSTGYVFKYPDFRSGYSEAIKRTFEC